MLFYRYDSFGCIENCSEEKDEYKATRERKRMIFVKTNTFNQRWQDKVFFFVYEISEDAVTIGAIVKNVDNVLKPLFEYLQAINMKEKEHSLEEITFTTLCNMLRCASRSDYIRDDGEVLELFDLDKLSTRYGKRLDYDENILDDCDKNSLYEAAQKLFSKETFIPELERIFAGKRRKNSNGHPVHYMIQTDDKETRKNMCRTLLQALFKNQRLKNKRYCFLNFRPGEDFSGFIYDCLYKSNTGGAVIVRYLTDDDTEDDHANYGTDTIEILCEIMKKYRNHVLTVFCLPRECTKVKNVFYENLAGTNIVELKEDHIFGESAKFFLKNLAKNNGIRANKKLFEKLEEGKDYLAPDLNDIFDDWYNEKLKNDIYPQYKNITTGKHEIAKATPKGTAYEELNQMIGLDEAKKIICHALNYCKAQKLFSDKGMRSVPVNMHMVFTGNPGTAKTSVARLFAKIMKENDFLSKGHLIEVGRGDLVGKYVGWTAPTIQKKFNEAQGGVLFIDEAYSLIDDRDGSFGDEAINTIVQEMENHRDDVVVIFAGYPDKMKTFLRKNPGLGSRIAYHVFFDDYDTESLCKIARLIAKRQGLTLTDGAYEKLANLFNRARKEDYFGNGRFVRNIIEKARVAQANRLLTMDFDSVKREDVSTICAEDIEVPEINTKKPEKRLGFFI